MQHGNPFNTLRLRQNGRHFAEDTFKCIFMDENIWILINISLKFVPIGPINHIPALVQIMAWRRPGDKPFSEPMMVGSPTHICVTRPQWVNIPAAKQTTTNNCVCSFNFVINIDVRLLICKPNILCSNQLQQVVKYRPFMTCDLWHPQEIESSSTDMEHFSQMLPHEKQNTLLTHWPLGDLNVILKMQSSILLYWLVSSNLLMIMSSDECHRTLLMISQHWFRLWHVAVRQQAITWANVDPDQCRHMASLGCNELIIIENRFSNEMVHFQIIHISITSYPF